MRVLLFFGKISARKYVENRHFFINFGKIVLALFYKITYSIIEYFYQYDREEIGIVRD